MSSEKTIKETLDRLITQLRPEIFTEEYAEKATPEEVLGIIISNYEEWYGAKIVAVLVYALEDANFHTLADKIKTLTKERFRD